MRNLISILFVLTFSTTSMAAEFGIEAGVRSQSGDTPMAATTTDTRTNYQIGGVGNFQIQDAIYLRSGLMYVQRTMDFKSTYYNAGTMNRTTATLTYFDIPVQGLYKIENYGSVFAGPVLSFILEKKIDTSNNIAWADLSRVKSLLVPFQIGASFKFAPQMGFTIFYEVVSGDVIPDFYTNARALGANLLFTFE